MAKAPLRKKSDYLSKKKKHVYILDDIKKRITWKIVKMVYLLKKMK